jgi:hypothetical protein
MIRLDTFLENLLKVRLQGIIWSTTYRWGKGRKGKGSCSKLRYFIQAFIQAGLVEAQCNAKRVYRNDRFELRLHSLYVVNETSVPQAEHK